MSNSKSNNTQSSQQLQSSQTNISLQSMGQSQSTQVTVFLATANTTQFTQKESFNQSQKISVSTADTIDNELQKARMKSRQILKMDQAHQKHSQGIQPAKMAVSQSDINKSNKKQKENQPQVKYNNQQKDQLKNVTSNSKQQAIQDRNNRQRQKSINLKANDSNQIEGEVLSTKMFQNKRHSNARNNFQNITQALNNFCNQNLKSKTTQNLQRAVNTNTSPKNNLVVLSAEDLRSNQKKIQHISNIQKQYDNNDESCNQIITQTISSNYDIEDVEEFNGNLSDRETSPQYRNYLSKKVVLTQVQDYYTPKSKFMLDQDQTATQLSPNSINLNFQNFMPFQYQKAQDQQNESKNLSRSTSKSSRVLSQDSRQNSQRSYQKSQNYNKSLEQPMIINKTQPNITYNPEIFSFLDSQNAKPKNASRNGELSNSNSKKSLGSGNYSKQAHRVQYGQIDISDDNKDSFHTSPPKHKVTNQFKSVVNNQVEVVQEAMLYKKSQEKLQQQLKKQIRTLNEENQNLQSVNNNLVQKIEFNEGRSTELGRNINTIRVEILKTNQERLITKDAKESELFKKDMERMELRIEVSSLKETLDEEVFEYKEQLQDQREQVQKLKDLLERAKAKCEEFKIDVKKHKTVEQERIKEVKINQKKLNIFIKQTSNHHKSVKANDDYEDDFAERSQQLKESRKSQYNTISSTGNNHQNKRQSHL
ncbi:UNKNOWN [Stylonychia lemnae]|uniref:Uncharacterized protein n=1 Tax=Stylonychia lemnae TaxID=5949 RepID=A0A078B7T3_STYLE|nr:UNKNOWN [Stylonychia lemnae]|eukprot:CDW90281.1 UNKNOWN [Stylonychia lemnae]